MIVATPEDATIFDPDCAGPGWAVGLDLGTTAVKAVLADPGGRIAARAFRPAPLVERAGEGAAEIPLAAYLASASSALAEVLAEAPRGEVVLGLASQRSSVVVWDRRTGRAWGPGLSWRDRRTPRRWPPGGLSGREIARRTGLRLSPHYGAAKIARLLEEHRRPPRRVSAAPLPAWVVWRWSGGRRQATDPTLAARMLLWNLEEGRWDPRLLRAFGIPRRILPAVRPSVWRHGTLRFAGRLLRLSALLGDQQAAAAALGISPGLGLLSLGTGAFLLAPTDGPVRSEGLLTTALWSDAKLTRFALEGTVNSAGALFDWSRRRGLGDPGREPLPPPAEAERLPACLPALAGTGAPRWDASARLRLVDASGERPPGEDPRAFRRAALLSVAYRLREIWDALPRAERPRRLLAAGGLSACRPLLQAVADLLGVPLEAAGGQASAALGAALLAQGLPGRTPASGPGAVLPRGGRERGYRRWRRLLEAGGRR